jgi:excisionase family DNA binding protein
VSKEQEPLMKKAEVACFLNVSTDTVDRLVRSGGLSALRVGRSVRFDRQAVMENLRVGKQS